MALPARLDTISAVNTGESSRASAMPTTAPVWFSAPKCTEAVDELNAEHHADEQAREAHDEQRLDAHEFHGLEEQPEAVGRAHPPEEGEPQQTYARPDLGQQADDRVDHHEPQALQRRSEGGRRYFLGPVGRSRHGCMDTTNA